MNFTKILAETLNLSKADDCIVIGGSTAVANLRWANNTTTTNGFATEDYIVVISIINKRVGAVAEDLSSHTDLAALVRRSEAQCEHQLPAEDYIPLVKGTGALTDHRVDGNTSLKQLEVFSSQLETIIKDARRQGLKLFGYAETKQFANYLATSAGVRKSFSHSEGHFSLNAKSADFKKSVWTGEANKDFGRVNLGSHYQKLLQRLEWSKTMIDIPAARYETILEPSALADLLIYAYWMAAAREANEGRSVYAKPGGGNRIGQKLGHPAINIYSDPAEPGLEVTPFVLSWGSSSESSVFDNGLGIKKTYWLKNGKLQNLIAPRWWAAKQKTQATPSIPNLIFDSPQGPSADEMIKNTKKGLLVTCLWYIREVDPQNLLLTGLTRDGVYLIENGKVKGAVNNFRFNMSPVDMLGQITEIGASLPALPREWGDYFTATKMPPVRVKGFNMSSHSQAI